MATCCFLGRSRSLLISLGLVGGLFVLTALGAWLAMMVVGLLGLAPAAAVSRWARRRWRRRARVLVVTKAVGNLIRENKTFQIHSILQTGSSQGMGLLDQSIRRLVDAGEVSREEALRYCEEPRSLAA